MTNVFEFRRSEWILWHNYRDRMEGASRAHCGRSLCICLRVRGIIGEYSEKWGQSLFSCLESTEKIQAAFLYAGGAEGAARLWLSIHALAAASTAASAPS